MIIKRLLARVAEKLTGRKCAGCLHNCRGRCVHPDGRMFMRCWHSITKPGFTQGLTTEEQHQLQKIKGVLQEAEDAARESGLLED